MLARGLLTKSIFANDFLKHLFDDHSVHTASAYRSLLLHCRVYHEFYRQKVTEKIPFSSFFSYIFGVSISLFWSGFHCALRGNQFN